MPPANPVAKATLIYNETAHAKKPGDGCCYATINEPTKFADLLVKFGTKVNPEREEVFCQAEGEDWSVGLEDEFTPNEGNITFVLRPKSARQAAGRR